jgi:hypothetical protein
VKNVLGGEREASDVPRGERYLEREVLSQEASNAQLSIIPESEHYARRWVLYQDVSIVSGGE